MNPVVQPWHDANFFGFTHVPLVVFDLDLSIAPCLSEKWTINPDGKSIEFGLVQNATWHDGLPVTADDVAFTIDYWRKNDVGSEGFWYNSYLDRVDVVDDNTIRISFKDSVALGALIAQIPGTAIMPKHIWENVESPRDYNGKDAMIGCGPFTFERFDKDADVVYLKRNGNYFGGRPSIDEIQWRHFKTIESLLLAIKAGDIDAQFEYYNPVTGAYVTNLLGTDNVQLSTVQDVGVPLHLLFGFKKYPTNITEFRQAVSYAIDYQALVDMILAGYGKVPKKGYYPPTVQGYNSDLPSLEYDPDRAKGILDNLGLVDLDKDGLRELPDGKRLSIPITPLSGNPSTVRAAEVISHQLQSVGLDTYVESLGKEAERKKAYKDRDYYINIGFCTPWSNILAEGAATYFADMPGMYGTCKDPELIELVMKTIEAKDINELKNSRSDMQKYISRELPAIALVWGDAIYPYRTDHWDGWPSMYGYGPVNYWTWFNLKRSQ
ncbi:MAG: Bacterial extracellular solute-binding proteins, family 5 Middle [Methanosaeta sp. PtaB.Bin039]|nr:MAG: Bacterial extracellular solute-binding proteins, family 5 Middle [Methanosaeta sp. PtaB.Bin039]